MAQFKEILEKAGYNSNYDNRSYYYKAVNNAIQNNGVIINIIKKGKAARTKDDFKYNYTISIAGKKVYFYNKYQAIDPESVLTSLGKLLMTPEIKNALNIGTGCKCEKCNGKGYISAFSHICKGVCFDCLGIGYRNF
jgi:hypothetical protein